LHLSTKASSNIWEGADDKARYVTTRNDKSSLGERAERQDIHSKSNDDKEAALWFRPAADNGQWDAQMGFGGSNYR
jgi:hypothetical protein